MLIRDITVGDRVEIKSEGDSSLRDIRGVPTEEMETLDITGKVLRLKTGEDAPSNMEVFLGIEKEGSEKVIGIGFDREPAERISAIDTDQGALQYGIVMDEEAEPRGHLTHLEIINK